MDDMKMELTNTKKPQKKYYHVECYEEYLEDKVFKEKEAQELDELRLVIQDIYGIDPLPNQAYVFLQKLRNGEPVFGSKQRTGKRYKQGYEYPLIKRTFEYCSDSIEWANANKDFSGFMGAFRYALAIIIDKIYIIEQKALEENKKDRLIEKHLEKVETPEEFVTSFKKKDDDDFFDIFED
jgi:hypothetical protein